jgi:hypothetical protein
MSNLFPILPGSPMARNIDRMEEVLRRMRQAASDGGVAEHFAVCDASRGGGLVKLSELYLSAEGNYDWQAFYHYAGVEARSRRYGSEAQVARELGPRWVRLSSENRLAWGHHLGAILQSLDGLHVSVSQDSSWRWDYKNVRPNGRPRYVPVYQLLICLSDLDRKPFQAASVAANMLARHCMADHPLADCHLFDWQDDLLGRMVFGSYCWHPTGFRTALHSKASLEEACGVLFKDLQHSVEKQGKGKAASWQVTVHLTQPEAVTA